MYLRDVFAYLGIENKQCLVITTEKTLKTYLQNVISGKVNFTAPFIT